MSTLLSADIGGTKTLLSLNHFESGVLSNVKQAEYKSAEWQTFDALLTDFLQDCAPCHGACFAVAGPLQHIQNDILVDVTNLPWSLSKNSLKEKFKLPYLSLINDFQAVGHSIDQLSENDLVTLQQGKFSLNGTRAFIGAGTGLGQAISVFNGLNYDVINTEGGHTDFAPNNDFEVALYQFLNQKYQHVSYERLLSGMGIINIYQFFLQICQADEAITKEISEIDSLPDKAKAISQMAGKYTDGLSSRTMDLFFRIYGAQSGNLALNCIPSGGLYIAGGIAPKNLEQMKNSHFLSSFNAKGRMGQLMQNIPVKVITAENAGLLGATNVALNQIKKH